MSIRPSELGNKKISELPQANQRFIEKCNSNIGLWIEGFDKLLEAATKDRRLLTLNSFPRFNEQTPFFTATKLLIEALRGILEVHNKKKAVSETDLTLAENHLAILEGTRLETALLEKWVESNKLALQDLEKVGATLFESDEQPADQEP